MLKIFTYLSFFSPKSEVKKGKGLYKPDIKKSLITAAFCLDLP